MIWHEKKHEIVHFLILSYDIEKQIQNICQSTSKYIFILFDEHSIDVKTGLQVVFFFIITKKNKQILIFDGTKETFEMVLVFII